jgi:hypothetical protein
MSPMDPDLWMPTRKLSTKTNNNEKKLTTTMVLILSLEQRSTKT